MTDAKGLRLILTNHPNLNDRLFWGGVSAAVSCKSCQFCAFFERGLFWGGHCSYGVMGSWCSALFEKQDTKGRCKRKMQKEDIAVMGNTKKAIQNLCSNFP